MGFMTGFLNESPKSHFHLDRHSKNIFDKLKTDGSILLTLFNLNNQELLNMGAQAPSPSKNYCQVVLNHNNVIFRTWHISLHVNSDSRFPSENISSYDDFVHDEVLQRDIQRVFGKATLTYILNIVENGKLDLLIRLPESVILKIISFLPLEDISKLSQVNCMLRQICRSDKVWLELYKKYYSDMLTDDLYLLAERDGWRKLFFTNKIKLKLELRRHAKIRSKINTADTIFEREATSIYEVPARIDGIEPKPNRPSKSAFKRSTENLNKDNHDKFKSIDRLNRIPGAFLGESM